MHPFLFIYFKCVPVHLQCNISISSTLKFLWASVPCSCMHCQVKKSAASQGISHLVSCLTLCSSAFSSYKTMVKYSGCRCWHLLLLKLKEQCRVRTARGARSWKNKHNVFFYSNSGQNKQCLFFFFLRNFRNSKLVAQKLLFQMCEQSSEMPLCVCLYLYMLTYAHTHKHRDSQIYIHMVLTT